MLVFFSDERCVPRDHEDSNYKACAAALLDKVCEALQRPMVNWIFRCVLVLET